MKHKVLHLPKWFPNKFDLQNGIFVEKQICAVSDDYEQRVLSVFKDPDLASRVHVCQTTEANVTYCEISFKPFGNKILDVFMHGYLGLIYTFKYAKDVTLIHTHIMGRNVFIGWLVSLLKPVKLVHTEHWSLFINPEQWKSKSRIYKQCTVFLLKRIHKVLAVSEPLNKKLQQIYPKLNAEVIGNVISENPFSSIQKKHAFTFIHVSDLRDDIKNISGVIEAFSQFKKNTSSHAELCIVGDGEDREKLRQKAKGIPGIYFLGRQTNMEVYKSLNASHCLLLNSKRETFGMVILEAFSCGLPVICTKNGMSEYFVDQNSGYIIDQDNTDEFAKALEKMKTMYAQFTPEHLKEKAKPFSKVVIGDKIKHVYKQLINEV